MGQRTLADMLPCHGCVPTCCPRQDACPQCQQRRRLHDSPYQNIKQFTVNSICMCVPGILLACTQNSYYQHPSRGTSPVAQRGCHMDQPAQTLPSPQLLSLSVLTLIRSCLNYNSMDEEGRKARCSAHPYGAGPSSSSPRSPCRCSTMTDELLAASPRHYRLQQASRLQHCFCVGAHREAADELLVALEAQADQDKVQRCQRWHGGTQRCRPGPARGVHRPAEQVQESAACREEGV